MQDEETLPDPGELSDGELELRLREKSPPVPERGWVAAYQFNITIAASSVVVGTISLRVGSNRSIRCYAGHIGYAVAELHRGHRYAARSVQLLVPLARRLGIDPIWITCDPENAASRRSCELAGAEFVEIVTIPEYHEMYAEGVRLRCRYRLQSASKHAP